MNDAELLHTLIEPAIGAILLAAFIHFATSGREPRGFQIFPSGEREWVRYGLRSVLFMAIGSVIVKIGGNADPLTQDIAGGSLLLSVLFSFMSWPVDKSLCMRCLILNAVILVLWLIPQIKSA